ncbi:MAG: hypothetical protein JXB47_00525 [Anaerolineae bacterium]|nr:hypothetical protein [Anaerolineae bacterium]
MIPTRYNTLPVKPWHVVLLVCVGYALATLAVNGGDPAVFIALGNYCDATLPGAPQGEPVEGYDGQFAYMIARDPANAHRVINRCDVAAYRYQRILYPLLARVLALGQDALIPWAMLLINVVAVPAGVYALERLLVQASVSRWYALSYGLFGGTLVALRLDLTEPLAYGLALAGVWAMETGEAGTSRAMPLFGAALFALAGLSKETAFLIVGGYLLHRLAARRLRDAAALGAAAVGPFLLWQISLKLWLGSFGVGSGGALATPFEWFPYNGVWRIISHPRTDPAIQANLARQGLSFEALLPSLLVLAAIALAVAALPSMWALWRSARDIWLSLRAGQVPHVYVFVLFAGAVMMPFVPFSTYREPLGILRFAVGLVIAVVLYGAHRRARRPLDYSLLWTLTLIFALSYTFA